MFSVLAFGSSGPVLAQDNPVFLDDSTLAADVFAGLPGLLASENDSEAVRLLQRLLDEEAERLIASDADPDVLEPVRARPPCAAGRRRPAPAVPIGRDRRRGDGDGRRRGRARGARAC
ncbi:MAG: hypothetical protein HND58_02380 [Planctomycetota bacterium]|nr:MAG: hypothetical protein HND58_02380 [Planctomycetota bacterium]